MLLVNQLVGFGAGGASGIEFVGYKTAAITPSAATNTDIAINSGLTGGIASSASSGDFVLVAYEVTSWSANVTLSITDGTTAYTLVGTEVYATDSEGSVNFRLAYKFITSDTNVRIGPTTSTEYSGIVAILVFRNVNTSTPLDVSASVSATAGTDDPVFSAITPVTPGAVIVAIGATAHQVGLLTYADPGGLTGFFSAGVDTGDNDSTIGFGRKNDWVSGSYTPPTFVLGSDRFFNNCAAQATIALRPV